MASRRILSPRTHAFIALVTVAGALAVLDLVGSPHRAVVWPSVLLFGVLAVLATSISIARRNSAPNRVTHQIGSAFVYPLLLLNDPATVCVVLCVTTTADALLNRRRPLNTVFNAAQLCVATWVSTRIVGSIWPSADRMADTDATAMAAAITLVLLFAFGNHALTYAVTSLANGRMMGIRTWIARVGLYAETLCIVSGLGMAVFWVVSPWLVVLGALPLWIVTLMLVQLSGREQSLEDRRLELRSLQGLGLKIGAELDPERLRAAILELAQDAIHASGALLAERDEDGFAIRAHVGIEPAPAGTLGEAEIDESLLGGRRPVYLDAETVRSRFPGLAPHDAAGWIVSPLEIRGKTAGLLALAHGLDRRPFDGADVRRIDILLPFINVALSNSALVAELGEVQSHLAHAEKMSAMGLLVSGVAHELNNPLTSVMGFAELLSEGEQDARRNRMIRRILDETRRAAKIVQNLLTFSRRQKPEKRLVDLNRIVEEVLEFRQYDLRNENISVVRNLAAGLPPVLADAQQIQQVVLNLLNNATQSIEETDGDGRVVIESGLHDGHVRLSIADNGVGIRRRDLDRIFVPFFSTKEVGRGTGLGLSICYGITQAHEGTLEARSNGSDGATFVLSLPAVEPASGTVLPEFLPLALGPAPGGGGGRLLVIDDEASIRELLSEAFVGRGWKVSAVADGDSALELMASRDFEAVLIDLRMPGTDGRAVVERVRSHRTELLPRIVCMTGGNDAADYSRLERLTGNPVFRKPLDLDRLTRCLAGIGGVNDSAQGAA